MTPEEVIEMADYLGINIKTEYDLLWIARQACARSLASYSGGPLLGAATSGAHPCAASYRL